MGELIVVDLQLSEVDYALVTLLRGRLHGGCVVAYSCSGLGAEDAGRMRVKCVGIEDCLSCR